MLFSCILISGRSDEMILSWVERLRQCITNPEAVRQRFERLLVCAVDKYRSRLKQQVTLGAEKNSRTKAAHYVGEDRRSELRMFSPAKKAKVTKQPIVPVLSYCL